MTALAISLALLAGASAARPAPAPLQIVLLVDVSGSLTRYVVSSDHPLTPEAYRRHQTLIWEASSGLAAAVIPEDRVGLGTFGARVRIEAGAVQGRRAIEEMAGALLDETGGPSPIWDALDKAVAVLQPRPDPRVVILVTDGQATGNVLAFADILDRVRGAGIAVFTLAPRWTGTSGPSKTGPDPSARLRKLADATCGGYLTFNTDGFMPPVHDSGDLNKKLKEILRTARDRAVNAELQTVNCTPRPTATAR